jgi:hypothetical protein
LVWLGKLLEEAKINLRAFSLIEEIEKSDSIEIEKIFNFIPFESAGNDVCTPSSYMIFELYTARVHIFAVYSWCPLVQTLANIMFRNAWWKIYVNSLELQSWDENAGNEISLGLKESCLWHDFLKRESVMKFAAKDYLWSKKGKKQISTDFWFFSILMKSFAQNMSNFGINWFFQPFTL